MTLLNSDQRNELSILFWDILSKQLTTAALDWLGEKSALIKQEEKAVQLNMSFSHLPRFSTKEAIRLNPEQQEAINAMLPGFVMEDWTLDRLGRVWLLMQLTAVEEDIYFAKINGLFTAAEMNELAALYAALPFLNYPERWIPRCEEGIRSNIGTVLEAIMYHNPYPAVYLSENAWNQLVLKAFFTEKDIWKITGIRERLNTTLSDTLEDYVQERLAAHREVIPEIYKLIELTKEKQ